MKRCVFTYARMNPPTSAHFAMLQHMASLAQSHDGEAWLFLSPNEGDAKNPIPFYTRLVLMQDAAKDAGVTMCYRPFRTIIELLKFLDDWFTDVHAVFGPDRSKRIEDLLKNYNRKDFDFDSVAVSTFQLDHLDVRSTLLRNLAAEDKYDEFRRVSFPMSEPQTRVSFDLTRKAVLGHDNGGKPQAPGG